MNASSYGHHVPIGEWFRYAAAFCGVAIVANWLALLVLEALRTHEWIPNVYSLNQAIVLAIVFASYVVGWRHELLGAALAFGGMVVFFALGYASVGKLPPLAAAWFVAPGVLYMLARLVGQTRHGATFQLRRW